MKRRHICDVPGCGAERQRWQRVCARCWRELPRNIRWDITDGHKCRETARHRSGKKRAGEWLAGTAPAPVIARPTPQQFQSRQASLLGEHD